MPTPLFLGNTNFREVETNPVVNRSGLDSLSVTLKGRSTALSSELANWPIGKTYPGYPNMFLDTRSTRDRGPVAEISLSFVGFIDSFSPENGLNEISDSITRQSVSLNTNEDENVTFQYFAQSTSYRWIHKGSQRPTTPKFRAIVPSTISTNQLFAPFPPKFTGSISNRYRVAGRLAQFDRTRLSPTVWAVVETWENLIEPT
jgi:hypothetical protein